MSLIDNNYRWYPVYTHSRAEQKTCLLLEKRGVVCYLPLQKTLKQWSDRKKWITEPLFRSYLFVYISLREYNIVSQTKGIVRFIYFTGKIAYIPDYQIQILKDYLSGELLPEISTLKLSAGKRVKIINGKLKGYEAEMVAWEQQYRLILRLDALGQSLLLKINASDVIVLDT